MNVVDISYYFLIAKFMISVIYNAVHQFLSCISFKFLDILIVSFQTNQFRE